MTSVFEHHNDLIVAGGPVRVYRSGDQGPPVLLLHGGALDTAEGVWRNVAPALSRHYRVVAIDLPRHGASRPWRGDLGTTFFDRFLEDLLNQLSLPRVAIIGLSLGGGLGIDYALRHPRRVSALIAIAPGGIGARRRFHFLVWLTLRTPGLLRLTSTYLARRPAALRTSLAKNLTAGATTRDFEAIVALVSAEATAKARHRERALDDWMINAIGPFRMRLDYLPELSGLQVPSLWVRGAHDRLVGSAEVAAAAAAAHADMVTIPNAGHILTYDQPGEFTRVAHRFLSAVIGDPQPGPGAL